MKRILLIASIAINLAAQSSAVQDETAVFAVRATSDSAHLAHIVKYFRIVADKIRRDVYKSARHSQKIGDDLDNYVIPALRILHNRYPACSALKDTLERVERFAQLPMCRPFLDVIDESMSDLYSSRGLIESRCRIGSS